MKTRLAAIILSAVVLMLLIINRFRPVHPSTTADASPSAAGPPPRPSALRTVQPPPPLVSHNPRDLAFVTNADPWEARVQALGSQADPGYQEIEEKLAPYKLTVDEILQAEWIIWAAGTHTPERARRNGMEINGEPFDEFNPKHMAAISNMVPFLNMQGAVKLSGILMTHDFEFLKNLAATPLQYAPQKPNRKLLWNP